MFQLFHQLGTNKEIDFTSSRFYDYGKVSIKILRRPDISYISLFSDRGSGHICSFMYEKNSDSFNFRRSNLIGNESSIEIDIDCGDFDEDESYLILKYGKIVDSSEILEELGITMMTLYSSVLDAIKRYDNFYLEDNN